tara:strand:- start:3497 stop:4447 length:951 start_codon:yes stop_codon:yes gene_type:complete
MTEKKNKTKNSSIGKSNRIKQNTIYNEDCQETLKRMKSNSIDLVITSPPYNMNLRISTAKRKKFTKKELLKKTKAELVKLSELEEIKITKSAKKDIICDQIVERAIVKEGRYHSRQVVKEFSTKYDGFSDNLPIEDYYNLHSSIISELLRVSKIVFYNIQIVTGSKRAVAKIIGEFSDYFKDIIIWDKQTAQPAMQTGVINRRSELILVFDSEHAMSRQYNQAAFARGTMDDIWSIKRGRKVNKDHGAVFPEELVEKILLNFSKEGDIVYDPFMGTGTTAVVAKRMNRKYVGSEMIKSFYKFSEERLSNTQLSLYK